MLVETDDLVTVSEAAKRKGVTRQSLYAAMERGAVECLWICGVPFLRWSEVERGYVPTSKTGKRERKVTIKRGGDTRSPIKQYRQPKVVVSDLTYERDEWSDGE